MPLKFDTINNLLEVSSVFSLSPLLEAGAALVKRSIGYP